MTVRLTIAAIAGILALTSGCGTSSEPEGDTGSEPTPASSTPTESQTEEPAVATLAESCDALVADVDADGDDALDYYQGVKEISDRSDTEAQLAFADLLAAAATLASPDLQAPASPGEELSHLQDLLDAQEARDGALGDLAGKCKAAGSTALQ